MYHAGGRVPQSLMEGLTPASADDLPPLGELLFDDPFWQYPAWGLAREGAGHLRVWAAATACSPPLRMSMTATVTVGTRGHGEPRPAGCRAGWWWTRWRRAGQSVAAASSLMAVRAEDSSTMVLPVA